MKNTNHVVPESKAAHFSFTNSAKLSGHYFLLLNEPFQDSINKGS